MSRLTEMQTRFKQKQLQEKEDKLRKLLVHPDQQTSSVQSTRMTVTQRVTKTGTVAQQQRYGADDRKPKAGIDRSYPLKPLKVNTTVSSRTAQATRSRTSLNTTPPLGRKSDFGCDDLNENRNIISTGNINGNSRDVKKINIRGAHQRGADDEECDAEVDDAKPKKPLRSRQTVEKIPSTPNPVPKARAERPPPTVTKVSPARRASSTVRAPPRPNVRETQSSEVNDNLAECKNCGRRFVADRLEVHEKICTKTAKKKRKTYDAVKHRVQGTDLEPFARKPPKLKSKTAATAASKKANWKQTHEEFINAIRAAKQAQAHLARGGKLSDLPPPPPSTNPDYVQCPNCGRRFNETAAARHIPKCANYSFNKTKSVPGVKVAPASKTRAMR